MVAIAGTVLGLCTVAMPRLASVVIPAYDEQDTILNVIRVAETHPAVAEVIVVSDGSTDRTVERARTTSAIVIDQQPNQGKGQAMDTGVQHAKHDVILFLDADISGLTHEMISWLIDPLFDNTHDMLTLHRDRKAQAFETLHYSLVLGGERSLRREIWLLLPKEMKKGFYIEPALNCYARRYGYRADMIFAPGLKSRIKEDKHGLLRGFWERMVMLSQWARVYAILFLFLR